MCVRVCVLDNLYVHLSADSLSGSLVIVEDRHATEASVVFSALTSTLSPLVLLFFQRERDVVSHLAELLATEPHTELHSVTHSHLSPAPSYLEQSQVPKFPFFALEKGAWTLSSPSTSSCPGVISHLC